MNSYKSIVGFFDMLGNIGFLIGKRFENHRRQPLLPSASAGRLCRTFLNDRFQIWLRLQWAEADIT